MEGLTRLIRESESPGPGHELHVGSTGARVVTLIGLAILLVALLAVYAITSMQVFNPDPCVLGECARQLLAGGSLYADVWQDKPPLAIFAYLIPQVVAAGSYLALQVFLALILVMLGAFSAMPARSLAAAWLSAM